MRPQSLLLILPTTLALPLTPRDTPTVTIRNHCTTSVYVTSIARERHNSTVIAPSKEWAEPLYYDGQTGTSLQVTTTPTALDHGGPILNAAYTYNKDARTTYYSLSSVPNRGEPFDGLAVKFSADKDFGSAIVWGPGAGTRSQSTKAFLGGETSLVLELCLS